AAHDRGGRRRTRHRPRLRRARPRPHRHAREDERARRNPAGRPPALPRLPCPRQHPPHCHAPSRRDPMTETAPRPLRIALVDDQPLVRTGFAMVIDSQDDMEVMVQAGDGSEAVSALSARDVDVVLMDVRMPRMDGIEATSTLLGRLPAERAPKIIVLTTFDLDEYVRSEEHTSELQSRENLVCRLL